MRRGYVVGIALVACAAGTWLVHRTRADDTVVASCRGDLDGDGRPDEASIVRLRPTSPPEVGSFEVRAEVGGRRLAFGPVDAVCPANLEHEFSKAAAVRELQLLPPEPLTAVDCNLDGRPELVARFGLPMSRGNVDTLVLAVDDTAKEFSLLWRCQGSDGVLCLDTTGNGDLALYEYVLEAMLPVFGDTALVWKDGRYQQVWQPIPPRLAEALVDVYALPRGYELSSINPVIMRERVRASLVLGQEMDALTTVGAGLRALTDAEDRVRSMRPQLLVMQGDLYAGFGSRKEALARYQIAYEQGEWDRFASAEGFAAFHFARARAEKGDLESAMEWLDEAERAEGEPGKFHRFRERLLPE